MVEEEESSYSSYSDLRRSLSLELIDRPPVLYRPPVRSLASPKLSRQEADDLTNPNLPYRTGYTYAFSKSYRPHGMDYDYEVPNMIGGNVYLNGRVTNSVSTSEAVSSNLSLLKETVVATWYEIVTLIYTTLATTYAGGMSLIEWIYYILYSAAYGVWYVTRVSGRAVFDTIYFILYSIGYGTWYVLDGIGQGTYAVADVAVTPFRAAWNYLNAPRITRKRKVSISSDYEVRYFDKNDSVSVSSKDSDESEEKGFSFFSPIRRFFRGKRSHRETIYDLRSRVIDKEVVDTDSENEENEGIRVRHLSPLRETPLAPPTTARLVQNRGHRMKKVSYADLIYSGVSSVGNSLLSLLLFIFDTLYAIPYFLVDLLRQLVDYLIVKPGEYTAHGVKSGTYGLYYVLLTIVDYILVKPASIVYNGVSRVFQSGSSYPVAPPVPYTATRRRTGGTVEEDEVSKTTLRYLRSHEDGDLADDGMEPPAIRKLLRSVESGRPSNDPILAALNAPSQRRSRRFSNSSSTNNDTEHVITTSIRRRVTRGGTGTLSSFDEEDDMELYNGTPAYKSRTLRPYPKSSGGGIVGAISAAPATVFNGTKAVVDNVIVQPVKYLGYAGQNTMNYALSPIYYLFGSSTDDSAYTNGYARTSTTSVKRGRGRPPKHAAAVAYDDTYGADMDVDEYSTKSTFLPVGGLLWAVKDSTTTVLAKILDVFVFAYFLIYELFRALFQLASGAVSLLYSGVKAAIFGTASGLATGTTGTASAVGGGLAATAGGLASIGRETISLLGKSASAIGSGFSSIGPSKSTDWCRWLKWLLLLLLILIPLLWFFAIPPFEKDNDAVAQYAKHVNSILEDYYTKGQYYSKPLFAAIWDGIYNFFARIVDGFRMLVQLIALVMYSVFAFIMDGLAALKIDKMFGGIRTPSLPIETPPPVIVAPLQTECPPPPPPVIVHAPAPSLESQEALVAAIVAKVSAQMEQKLSDSLNGRMHIIEENVKKAEEELRMNVKVSHEPIDYSSLEMMIKAAIKKYDSDKTGLVDFALETAGGQVVSTRCSETYPLATRLEKIFNIPLYYSNYGPRTVIQRNSQALVPGECWAFKGGIGYLTIKLAHPINVTAVSYEHIPRSISPSGENKSAPRTVTVYSYENDEYNFKSRFMLGQFIYDNKGEPLQFFPITEQPSYPVQIIEFQVDSNYGMEYTCLYRFRVHGDLFKKI